MSGDRVLVVDDEPGVVALCRRFLTRAGYAVETSVTAEDALVKLGRQPVDLLLVDVRMPGMDGFELMREARRRQPDLAVVVMTGFGTVETAVRALEEGASGLVLKPFDSNVAVVRQVRLAIEANRSRREVARSRALRPLFDLAEVMFAETEEAALAQRVSSSVRSQLGCESAGLYLHDDGSGSVRLLSWAGREGELSEAVRLGPVAWAAEGRALARFQPEDPTLLPERRAWLEEHGFSSALCCPVRRSQGTFLMFAGRGGGQPPFSGDDLEMLYLLTRQAAVALENARLYGALRAYVSEIERSQQRLVQSEKLAAIGRLTASIAHEVNNPLQSLRNCLDLAARGDLAEERRAEYLRMAQRELEHLTSIVRQMLEFYRPEAATRQSIDVNDLLHDVVLLTAGQCHDRGVEVVLTLSSELPAVWGVPYQLKQVVMNMVLNAIEAMPDGGRLTIASAPRAQGVEITFRDTGRGISKEEMAHIFEPFYTSKQTGTGLGLAISYGIVAAHDGVIQVESDPGAGATFSVILPPVPRL